MLSKDILESWNVFFQASQAFVEDTLGNISMASEPEAALASADLVIEAVTENLKLKQAKQIGWK